jgi:hypothetical protein
VWLREALSGGRRLEEGPYTMVDLGRMRVVARGGSTQRSSSSAAMTNGVEQCISEMENREGKKISRLIDAIGEWTRMTHGHTVQRERLSIRCDHHNGELGRACWGNLVTRLGLMPFPTVGQSDQVGRALFNLF